MRLFRTTGFALLATAAALTLGGCSFITGVRGTSKVTVTVSPTIIGLNQNAQAIGTAFDGNTPLSGNSRYTVTYTSRDPNIATVDQARGLITGVAYGTTYIVGENRGSRDSALITVRPIQAVQLVIGGSRTPTYRIGAPNTIGATAFDSASRAIGDRPVSYTARNTAVLTVSSIGVVQPVAAGTSWIVASIDNGPGNKAVLDSVLATVTVVPIGTLSVTPNNTTNPNLTVYVGLTQQFAVAITDSLGKPTTRTVTWSTTDGGQTLAIDPASGLARGVQQILGGQTAVVATVPVVPGDPTNISTARAQVAVNVLSPVDSVRVFNPSFQQVTTVTVANGSTTAIILDAIDALRFSLTARTYSVTSSNAAVATSPATNSGSLQIVARATGTTTLTIRALDYQGNPQGKTSTLTVTVQ